MARLYRPPLPEARLSTAFKSIPLLLPDEWYEMYACFDGVAYTNSLARVATTALLDWSWMPSAVVDEAYVLVAPRLAAGEEQQMYFGMGFGVPWIGLDFSRVENNDVPVIAGMPGHDKLIAFDSLKAMLATIVAANQRGVIDYDANGEIVYERSRFAGLVEEINRRDEYWRQFASK